MLNKIIKYFLENKLVTILVIVLFVGWGLVTAQLGRVYSLMLWLANSFSGIAE